MNDTKPSINAMLPLEVTSNDGEIMVELDYIGEGFFGDFNKDDADDSPLLRFTLFRMFHDFLPLDKIEECCETDGYIDGDWMQVKDGSYCTQIPATTPIEQVQEIGKFILEQVHDSLRKLERTKRLYQQLSWVQLKDGKPTL